MKLTHKHIQFPVLFLGLLGFATVTFAQVTDFAKLPHGLTSFGAARLGNHVYVFGGHTGGAHSYSQKEQSNELLRLDVSDPSAKWEKVASAPRRLQGLAIVPYEEKIILVGGFEAMNEEGEDQDLHSRPFVTAYNTKTDQWEELPALPVGRSSHDAVILDGVIYAVGGWTMNTPEETQWHSTALALDLNAEQPSWTELPEPPFQRRALALVPHAGKLYAIGGMTPKGTTRATSIYDPASKTWEEGPELAGKDGMAGFGSAAWSTGGKLVVANYYGDIQVLSEDGSEWKVTGQTDDARFFHRLLPLDESHLLSVGGASMETGKFLKPEVIAVQ